MGSELNIAVTDQELAYRSKNYSELKAYTRRELFCGSCGNILSHNFKHVYSHPIFDILQCENCKNHFKTVTFSLDKDDSVRYCHICGRERSSSYHCIKQNCPYEFCKTCIKRNVPQSLVDAESGKWKCFACNTKPLWKLRGACAAVMSSLPKRTKAKKKSRANSSDREDKRSNLKERSYVRRTQLETTQRLSKKLQSICDEESPNFSLETQSSLLVRKQNKSSNLWNGNSNVRTDRKISHGGETSRCLLSLDTSSEDTDIEEIVPFKIIKNAKSKSHRENSSDRTKIPPQKRKSENRIREYKDAKRANLGKSKNCAHSTFNCDDNSGLDNSNDESNVKAVQPTEFLKEKSHAHKRLSSKKAKNILHDPSDDEEETQKNDIQKKSSGKTMPTTNKKPTSKRGNPQVNRRRSRTISRSPPKDDEGATDSSSDDSETARLKALMPTAFAKKPKTNEKNIASSAKRKESLNDDEEKVNSRSMNSSKSTKPSTLKAANISKSNRRMSKRSTSREPIESTPQNHNTSSTFPSQNVSVMLKDIVKVVDEKSRKTFGPLRLRSEGVTSQHGSDSSSSKEFNSSKLVGRKSYGGLRRMQNIEEDHTMSSPGSSKEFDNSDVIPKEQSFALKKTVHDFFDDLRAAAKKLIDDIDTAEKTYCMKEQSMRASMRPVDANRMILETKDVLTTLKERVDQGETKIVDYYEGWCKKTRQKNVWRRTKARDTETKPSTSKRSEEKEKGAKTSKDSDSESSDASMKIAQPKNRELRANNPEDPVANVESSVVVSDCDSDIFSDGEMRASAKKNIVSSPNKHIVDKKSKENLENSKKGIESKKSKLTYSSDDTEVAACANEHMDDEPNKPPEVAARIGSPTLSQFSENESPNESRSKTASPTGRYDEKPESTHLTDKNKVLSDIEEDMNDQPVEGVDVTPRADSPTLSQFSENEAPSRNTSVSRSKTATPVERINETDNLNTSIDPFASNDDNSEPEESPPKDAKEVEPINRKKLVKRKSMQVKSKALVSDSDSEHTPKGRIRRSSSATNKSRNSDLSLDEKLNDIEAAKHEDKNSVEALSDASTEINPFDHVATLIENDPVDGDAENPEKSTVEPSIDVKEPSETDSVANCDIRSMATEINCLSGTQSQLSGDEQQLSSPGTPPSDDVFTDDKPIEQKEGAAKEIKKISKDRKTSKNREKNGETKCSDSAYRSSLGTNESGDRKESTKKSNRKKNSDSSSDLSDEDENMRAKKLMLMSSNSDDSSGELGSRRQSLNTNKSNDSPLTPPESDSKSEKSSKDLVKDSKERDSEGTEKSGESEKPRKKRSKFRITKNRYYMEDDKLKQKCEIRVPRLAEDILKNYSRALRKSRKYVESKEIKRLVALDGLGKDRKRVDSSSDDEDKPSNLKRGTKKTRAKEREETLMDHLNKIENGESIVLSSESENENSTLGKKDKLKDKTDDPFAEANIMAKKRMLDSSGSGSDEPASDAKDDEEVKKPKKVVKKEKVDKASEDEETKKEKSEKGRWRKSKILTLKISDSDSEEDARKYKLSQEKLAQKKLNQGSDSEEEASPKKKKRVRRRVLHSDSEVEISPMSDSDSDDSVESTEKKKKKKDDSSDEEVDKKKTRKRTRRTRSSDSSMDEKRPKTTRRKRIKAVGSDSDSDEDLENSQGTPGKSGRKNIRKVLRDKQVADDTKQAAKDEEERLKRIADRQKLYNEMYEVRLAGEEKVDKLVLDFDEETKEPLVSVDEGLVKRLKPHQAQGIKFMWDACFESVERIKNSKGSGCILAHCMGLGKSFQIVTLAHTLLTHPETGVNTVLIVCPLSTVLNWANEFKIWLADLPTGDDIEVYELTKLKKNTERKYKLEEWRQSGGVMIIGYEMFRNLSNTAKKVRKNIQESFLKSLVNPGPDLIVCDEGHLLKKEGTAISKAMSRVNTLRRIVLTGTPLQNNLIEYHCMVQFVKPNLLGTKKEFSNRFENPITNGQFDDSTEYDVKLMKKRAHVLHKMLEGSVQRFDYSVLTPFLPPKQEYVIFVKLTEIQVKMYQHYLENYARRHRGVGGSLFADFQALQRIWTHPYVMQMNAEKVDRANEKKRLDASDSEGSLRDFIDDGSDTPCSSNSDIQSASGSDEEDNKPKPKRGTRANPVPDEPVPTPPAGEETNDETAWWTQFIESDDVYEDIRISSKLLMLFSILKESEQIGDKVLVFSQSLYSLTLIEKFLGMIDDETQRGNHPENLDGHSGSWALGLDYFRLDGQSSADNRRLWCNIFNKPTNTRARLFLISTRAGGLGINLTAANRVIIFDASWNPSHDVQSIFRIYRFGQKKPCYVYRLLAAGTMEEKIYNRQVTKLSLSCRVVDEQQIERHYSNNALAELYQLELPSETESTLNLPKDRLLAEIFLKYKHSVVKYLEHDSLLENQADEGLDEEERQQAWLEYEEEKKGKRLMPTMPYMNYQDQALLQQINMMNMMQQQSVTMNNPAMLADLENLQRLMQKDYPGLPEAQQKMMASKVVYDMYNYVEKQAMAGHGTLPMMNMPAVGAQFGLANQIQGPAPVIGHPSMDTLRMYQQSLAQAQNGQINNYQNNQGLGISRQTPAGQMGQMTGMPTSSSIVDDDIMEIPSSPDRNPIKPAPAPGGSRKSKEE